MSRAPRFSYPEALHHVTLRCNNREFLFKEPSFRLFREIVQEGRAKFGLSLHNYCLMTNHVHLLFKVPQEDTLSKAMQWMATSFSRRFNKAARRHGHLWEGRFRSTVVEDESYFLRCMAYLDLNPVRAGMASTLLDYPWCGHQALRAEDHTELDLHPSYLALGSSAGARYEGYVRLLNEEAARSPISLARQHFVGTPSFVDRMIKRFGLRWGKSLRVTELDSGLICVGPEHGGSRRTSASR